MIKFTNLAILKQMNYTPDGLSKLEGETLRKYQKCLLSMAKDVIDVCEKEGIVYCLSAGTALGAVRHGGFIPWDDDMDIIILGSDYARFRECFLREHGDKYSLNDANSRGIYQALGRVSLKGSVLRTPFSYGSDPTFVIDVFRMENVPDNLIIRYLHGALCMAAAALFSCWHAYEQRSLYKDIVKTNKKYAWVVYLKLAIGFVTHIIPGDWWTKFVWTCNGLCKNNQSKYVTMPLGRNHYFKEMILREKIVNTVKMPFEGYQWAVAEDYDTYLKQLYGPDYMTPSPPEKREYHYYSELVFPDEN